MKNSSRIMCLFVMASAGAIFLCSCAGVSVRRDTVRPTSQMQGAGHAFLEGLTWTFKPRGVRYYQPADFIYVFVDGNGFIKSEHIILPDRSRKLSARPSAFLGSAENKLTFTNGMLLNTVTTADSTVVPNAIITMAKELAKSAVQSDALFTAAFADADAGQISTSFQMFRLLPGKDGPNYVLLGNNGYRIDVPFPEPKKGDGQ